MRTLKVTHNLISRVNDYQFYDIDLLSFFLTYIYQSCITLLYNLSLNIT